MTRLRVTPKLLEGARVLVALADARQKLHKQNGWSYQGFTAKDFARAMWPDSPGWERSQNVGPNGSARGVCMPRLAGAFLFRMYAADLAWYDSTPTYIRLWYPTDRARELAASE